MSLLKMSSQDSQERAEQLHKLAKELAAFAINKNESSQVIQESQLLHRLNILRSWFGDLEASTLALQGNKVVEIGCGQGDMTIAIAHFVSQNQDKVYAIDPAPLDYGSPFTLEQAQGHLSKTLLGHSIEWIQADPMEASTKQPAVASAGMYILAHSSFYLKSKEYFSQLLRHLAISGDSSRPKKLLFAEWGMRVSVAEAEPHLLAVRAQELLPLPSGNIQTVVPPSEVKLLAEAAGWKVEKEVWIESPKMDDGRWEVFAAKRLRDEQYKMMASNVKELLDEMEKKVTELEVPVQCMDVWTCVFVFDGR
ncbi:Hypothetical protein R9X50_00053400 [Acrodontium crateriforme]|uniref:Methyltransferase domain-containing protein n=1 Tax=Acrodontium crateriforme TaxID=150365 RepID=A0AAQ3LXG5_9PEZI|nr:Hypothetical protein R9X50_00053400 [Acrodontium crateriforme]